MRKDAPLGGRASHVVHFDGSALSHYFIKLVRLCFVVDQISESIVEMKHSPKAMLLLINYLHV